MQQCGRDALEEGYVASFAPHQPDEVARNQGQPPAPKPDVGQDVACGPVAQCLHLFVVDGTEAMRPRQAVVRAQEERKRIDQRSVEVEDDEVVSHGEAWRVALAAEAWESGAHAAGVSAGVAATLAASGSAQ